MTEPVKKETHNILESLLPLAVTIDKVKLDPRNARTHPEPNMAAIQQSLKAYGQRKPIVVNARTGEIEAGNGLFQAAVNLGWTQVAAVMVTDDEDTAKGYAIMDNQSALLAEWDFPVLKDLLQELDTGAFDMDLTGFNQGEIEDLMTRFQVIEPGKTDDDAIPEEVETICKTGDLWMLGNHRLLCGDATIITDVEKLMGGEKADMVFTDPPYGIAYKDVKGKHKPIVNDNGVAISELLALLPFDIPSYVCCNWQSYPEYYKAIPDVKALIVWDKGHGVQNLDKFYKRHEFIIYRGEYGGQKTVDGDVWLVDREVRADHPTAKPVLLIEKAIGYSSFVGQIVLDLFGGSGSTLIACEKLGRRCFMMEIDEHYCDVIIKRWEDFTGRKAVKL